MTSFRLDLIFTEEELDNAQYGSEANSNHIVDRVLEEARKLGYQDKH